MSVCPTCPKCPHILWQHNVGECIKCKCKVHVRTSEKQ